MTSQKLRLFSPNGAGKDYSKILNHILGRAWVDPVFRDNLLTQTPATLEKHGLPSQLVNSLPVDGRESLEILARQLLLVFDGHEE